jgi:DNA-binding PadR family transcriptional regulator
MTGKEIIDKAALQSEGRWRPSPGLIYPLLGRLVEEGLIEERKEDGRYSLTKKGLVITSDLESFGNIFQKQLDVVMRVGSLGKFVTMDLLERVATIGSALSSNLDRMTAEEREKYREFLVNELKKLDEQEKNGTGKEKVSVE